MAFNPNVIPPEHRNKAQVAIHLENYKRKQDTIRVHNPSKEDFVVHNDRMVSNERWVIPNVTKDVGKGKGNTDVPRYIAERYINKMGLKMINKISEADWEKKKTQFRIDERGEKEERMAIRLNNREEWAKIVKQLWVGVVSRYQEEIIPEETPQPKKQTFSRAEEILESLDLADAEVGLGEETQQAKDNFADQIS